MVSGLLGGLLSAFNLHRAELLRFLAARCGDPAEAEDLLQDLWLKVQSIDTGQVSNARAYLFQIANNAVIDRRRSRLRSMTRDRGWIEQDGVYSGPPDGRPDPSDSAEDLISARQEAEVLRKAIAGLPDGARRALVFYRFEGRPQAEIAQLMGISRSGVEKHLALAMKHLRNALSDCGFFEGMTSRNREGVSRPGPDAGAQG